MFWNKKCQHKYGKVDEKDLQYCEFCGEARRVEPQECSHKWDTIGETKETNMSNGNIIRIKYIMKCANCGDIKTVDL